MKNTIITMMLMVMVGITGCSAPAVTDRSDAVENIMEDKDEDSVKEKQTAEETDGDSIEEKQIKEETDVDSHEDSNEESFEDRDQTEELATTENEQGTIDDSSLESIIASMEPLYTQSFQRIKDNYDAVIEVTGDNYDTYTENYDLIKGWYKSSEEEADATYQEAIKLAKTYYLMLADTGVDDYDEWDDAMDDFYEAWDDAMKDYYDDWDDLYKDSYDYSDDTIKPAYDDHKYGEVSDMWSEMYNDYSDAWSEMYEMYSDTWSDLYNMHSDVWSKFYKGKTDIQRVLDRVGTGEAGSDDEE